MRQNDIQPNKVYTNICGDIRLVNKVTKTDDGFYTVTYTVLNQHREPIKIPKTMRLHSFAYWAYQEDIIGSAVYKKDGK